MQKYAKKTWKKWDVHKWNLEWWTKRTRIGVCNEDND
jgi:hypothetical protein